MPRLGENPTYDTLVASVRERFAGTDEMRVVSNTHGLEAPAAIGGYTPELTARSEGRFIIGVARTGVQLRQDLDETVAALREFLAWRGADGERAVVHLRVPKGWEEYARQAVGRAGVDLDDGLCQVGSVEIPGVRGPE